MLFIECKPCEKPGHICDMETGECVCPPNTMGDTCDQCKPMYWGYDPRFGCKVLGQAIRLCRYLFV